MKEEGHLYPEGMKEEEGQVLSTPQGSIEKNARCSVPRKGKDEGKAEGSSPDTRIRAGAIARERVRLAGSNPGQDWPRFRAG
jgi:hypothetical protein